MDIVKILFTTKGGWIIVAAIVTSFTIALYMSFWIKQKVNKTEKQQNLK